MSHSTQPALVSYGPWNDETRKNPAMKFMEDYTRHYIDERKWVEHGLDSKHHTEDFSVLKPDGSLRKGREDAAKAIQEIYGPFASHNHRPNFLVTWETKDGYAMSGEADVFFNLHGVPAGNESDGEGGKWHGHISAAFRFDYVREESDIKLKATRIFSDASPALKLMLQNKQIDGNALVGILGA